MPRHPTAQQLPAVGPRVETGVLAFGSDWSGVFLRGDNALAAGLAIVRVLEGTADWRQIQQAAGVAELLLSCHEGEQSRAALIARTGTAAETAQARLAVDLAEAAKGAI